MRVFGKEFRIFKRDWSGPLPLIAHPRFYRLHRADIRLRGFISKITGCKFRKPKYLWPQRTDEEYAQDLAATERFLGSRSPVPLVARYYREQSRLARLARDNMSAETRQELLDSGPLCTAEDEAYMQMSDDDRVDYLRHIAEERPDHPDHAAVAAWVNKEPVKETTGWLV